MPIHDWTRIHALVVDPFPPGKRDPNGIRGAVWPELGGEPFTKSADKPLTVVSYEAGDATGSPHRCHVRPLGVGESCRKCPCTSNPTFT